ncbi:MAG: DedA family protein [Rhodospirillaceae bacterium]|nr:DedA family protein [Rhodospirillaceae bacterium]
MNGYISLFISAFLAATIVPFSSEAVLATLSIAGGWDVLTLWLVASTANTLGAAVNWALGRWLLHYQDRKWFPFKQSDLDKADTWFQRYGVWSLLLSWVPLIGDPITFAAGFLRVRFSVFIVLVALAKSARYAVVIALAQNFI